MHYSEHTLPNDLRIIHEPTLSKAAYCGFAIDAGTRDEAEDKQGMAHLVEHLIFKGTEKRKVWHILNRMENVGGGLNAYTNKEETVVYTVSLTRHPERALELLGDIVFHSTFPQHRIEKETGVIIGEIQSYEDDPSELTFDDFEDTVFRNYPLRRDIPGKPELPWSFRMEGVLLLTSCFYQPGNMVLFVRGQYDFEKIIHLTEKHLFGIPAVTVDNQRMPPPFYASERLVVSKDTHQAHVVTNSWGYNVHDDKYTAFYLLNNMLGSPDMNNRLNVLPRERRGLVYNIEPNPTPYTDIGAFCVYFGTSIEDMGTRLKLTYKELKRMWDAKMTSFQLVATKKQLIGQIDVAPDNFKSSILGMAKTYLHYHKHESSESVFHRIEASTAEQLLEAVDKMFVEEYLSTLIYK